MVNRLDLNDDVVALLDDLGRSSTFVYRGVWMNQSQWEVVKSTQLKEGALAVADLAIFPVQARVIKRLVFNNQYYVDQIPLFKFAGCTFEVHSFEILPGGTVPQVSLKMNQVDQPNRRSNPEKIEVLTHEGRSEDVLRTDLSDSVPISIIAYQQSAVFRLEAGQAAAGLVADFGKKRQHLAVTQSGLVVTWETENGQVVGLGSQQLRSIQEGLDNNKITVTNEDIRRYG
jgi:hypothetical protein